MTLGHYGRGVLERFRRMHTANPILQPCEHSHPQVNSQRGFVQIDLEAPWFPAIPPDAKLPMACLVLDPMEPGAMVWAEGLADTMFSRWQTRTIALFPNGPQRQENRVFTFYWQVNGDSHMVAAVLHSLYACWYGCGGIGNLMCLKVQLDDLRAEKATTANVAVCHAPYNGGRLDELVQTALARCRNGNPSSNDRGFYFIWQAPKSLNWEMAMDGFGQIVTHLEAMCGVDVEILGLPHPSRQSNDQRLVLFERAD